MKVNSREKRDVEQQACKRDQIWTWQRLHVAFFGGKIGNDLEMGTCLVGKADRDTMLM